MGDTYDDYTVSKFTPYVSCIKINGIPILPPLMTDDYRQEMLHYKQLAMAVERKMSDKFSIDETTINSNIIPSDSEDWGDGTNISNISYKSDHRQDHYHNLQSQFFITDINNEFESMNSQVTVIDNDENSSFSQSANVNIIKESSKQDDSKSNESTECTSFINKSLDNSKTEEVFHKPLLKSTPKKDVPVDNNLNYNVQNVKTLDISKCNIVEKVKTVVRKDVSKVESVSKTKSHTKSSAPVKSVKSKKSVTSNKKENALLIKGATLHKRPSVDAKKSSKNSLQRNILTAKNKTNLSPSKNITGSLNNISSGLASPPKLFRQNSYTLEYPSPLLLAHLEEQSLASGVDLHSISMSESTSTSYLCNSSKQKSWDATAKETWSSIGSDINSISMNENSEVTLSTKENIKKLNDSFKQQEKTMSNIENKSSLVTEMKQHSNDKLLSSDNIETENSLKLSNAVDKGANDYLNQILKKIQDEHEKQLNDLLKKQQEEQLNLKKTFENQQKMLLSQFEVMYTENKSIKDVALVKSNNVELSSKDDIKEFNDHEIDPETEKYLSLSAKVLNKSRSLLSNRQNQTSMKKHIVDENLNYNKHSKAEADVVKKESIMQNGLEPNNNKNNDDNEDFMTEQTNDTLDDIKTNFTDDGLSSVRDTSITDSFVSEYRASDVEGVSKLKSAFDKINKIQKNFASQHFRDFSVSLDESQITQRSPNQSISLSSINMRDTNISEPEQSMQSVNRNMLSLNLIDIHRPVSDKVKRNLFTQRVTQREIDAATTIVAYSRGYLTRRLMHTEKVESIVQTIRDTLLCALQLHRDEGGIRGADVDLHRRLIQQITAACYALHDTFITSTCTERMSIIAQDRERKVMLSHRSSSSGPSTKQLSATTQKVLRRKMERMSRSHTGVFSTRPTKMMQSSMPHHMTRSHYDQTDHIKIGLGDRTRRSTAVAGELVSRKPWR